jgi:hypothetical protein
VHWCHQAIKQSSPRYLTTKRKQSRRSLTSADCSLSQRTGWFECVTLRDLVIRSNFLQARVGGMKEQFTNNYRKLKYQYRSQAGHSHREDSKLIIINCAIIYQQKQKSRTSQSRLSTPMSDSYYFPQSVIPRVVWQNDMNRHQEKCLPVSPNGGKPASTSFCDAFISISTEVLTPPVLLSSLNYCVIPDHSFRDFSE